MKVYRKNGITGPIIGWTINGIEIMFQKAYLDCDEHAVGKENEIYIDESSYHFQPCISHTLYQYRIDLDKSGTHLNTETFLKLPHRLEPDQLTLDINNFNCLLAIHLALD